MTLTVKHPNLLDIFCDVMCKDSEIQFCGIINSRGNMVACKCKDKIPLRCNDQQRKMLYMQSRLELVMKADFNDNLGSVNYIVTYRDDVIMVCIPSDNQQHHVLIFADKNSNVQKIIINVANLFKEMEEQIKPPSS